MGGIPMTQARVEHSPSCGLPQLYPGYDTFGHDLPISRFEDAGRNRVPCSVAPVPRGALQPASGCVTTPIISLVPNRVAPNRFSRMVNNDLGGF
jgi:hypothetical protein